MMSRRGFSLVEMVIVLVLAGIVSTAAINMFSTQNRLNAQMTALGESQENARSAVQVVAAEIRSAGAGASITAHTNEFALSVPFAIGIVCGRQGGFASVYFPIDGSVVDLRRDLDRKAVLVDGIWERQVFSGADGFNGASSRQQCVDAGGGTIGTDANYARIRVSADIGEPVMLQRNVNFMFAPSTLNPGTDALYRSVGDDRVELASGFAEAAGFQYQVVGDTTWQPYISGSTARSISAVRINAVVEAEHRSGVESGSAEFDLVRDIQLRNVQ